MEENSIHNQDWKLSVKKMGRKLLNSHIFHAQRSAYFIMAHELLGVKWPDTYLGKQMQREKYNNSTLFDRLKWGTLPQMALNVSYMLF